MNPEDMVTFGELLTVQDNPDTVPAGPTTEKLELIDDNVCAQSQLSPRQQEQLQEVLVKHHEAVLLDKSDMGRTTAVPHILRPKTEEPAYVKQFSIPAAHLNSPVCTDKKPHSEVCHRHEESQ